MAEGKLVTEFDQLPTSVLRSVWLVHSVMKMNFSFAPARMAMLGQHLNQLFVVLLGRIKIGVNQSTTVMVAQLINHLRIFSKPCLLAPQLLVARHALVAARRIEGGLKMIGEAEDDVDRPRRTRAQRVQRDGRQHPAAVCEFFVEETHSRVARTFWSALASSPLQTRGLECPRPHKLHATQTICKLLAQWLPPPHRDGEFSDVHILHAHRLIPAENLLIGMF